MPLSPQQLQAVRVREYLERLSWLQPFPSPSERA